VSTILTMEYIHHRDEPPEEIAEMVVVFCRRGIGVQD